jgi:formylglycine-generating enzyme required for sulfatase activity/ribose 1,5-bisphosphokinase PhnN
VPSITIRVFISSPADVRPERLKAEQIVARLDREFAYHFDIESVQWEREPLVAAHHFQHPDNIPQPRSTDIVVVILWSRLGVPLPEDQFRGAITGRPVTGTEWEFEDALASARERGVPELLLYRKTARITADLDDESALEERRVQRGLVQDFIKRWFHTESGPGYTAALHSFSSTGEFEEKLYDHLLALLKRRAGTANSGVAIRWSEAPFRALLSYEYEHAPVFFGRTRARNELREVLARQIERGTAFVLVLGASGSGKSSLVKAGLLSDLSLPGMIGRIALVRRALMRPSDAPSGPHDALAAAILSPTALPELAKMQYSPGQLGALLREAPGQAVLPIRQGLTEASRAAGLTDIAEARLAIVVDQLEEMFTIERLGERDREALVAVLAALARSGLVWVIATMRSDFFDRLETMPALASLSADGRFLLLPPDAAEIDQIICQPAQEAGVRFEHDAARGLSLDEAIHQAAARDCGALPLLSSLLDQLWRKRSEGNVLTFAAYEELGGLEGAIGHRAEAIFQGQPESVRSELVPLLRALVTVRGATATARIAPLSVFPRGSARRALVDAFLHPDARLLIATGDAGAAQLRLAHEALLTHWPRAHDQIVADGRDLELRGRLEQEAELWHAAPKRQKKGRVRAAGLPLAEARGLLARWGSELPMEIADFIAASSTAAWWGRFRLWGIVAAAPLVVAFVAVLIWAGRVWWGVHEVEAAMKFVAIPEGCFLMGSPDNEAGRYKNEEPVRNVCLKPFDLAQYSVTQGEWRRVMIFPNNPEPSTFKGSDRHPVESVSWNNAQRFVSLMSFFGQRQYRLPSEAEYEYAARAGTTTPRYWGERAEDGCVYENTADLTFKLENPYDERSESNSIVNCDDHYAATAPVGSFKSNPWGLNDMLGNVVVWMEDCYEADLSKIPTDGSPFSAPDCQHHTVRGSSFEEIPRHARAADRIDRPPGASQRNIGLRMARTNKP